MKIQTNFCVAYIPIGVGTFHLESAQKLFLESQKIIRELSQAQQIDFAFPEKMLLSLDDLGEWLNELERSKKEYLLLLQNVTFANAAYATEVFRRFKDSSVTIWTLREPVIDGGRLRLNSLTGAFSAANAFCSIQDGSFEYVFGSPDEKEVQAQLKTIFLAAKVKSQLRACKLAAVGHTPDGFGFGRALDSDLSRAFGTRLISVEARELILKAKKYSPQEIEDVLQKSKKILVNLDSIPEQNVLDFARLYKAYTEFVEQNKIAALASRCWPDFFVDFGTPVCAVLSLLNMDGIPSSCESDLYGALSMLITELLGGEGAFFGDPVSLDEKENTLTFWHCGMANCSLARSDTGANVGVHPNRKIGPTMEFGCKPSSQATIFRVGRTKDGSFRFFISEGEILDKPRQFLGTSLVVKTKTPSKTLVKNAVLDGWEPHFVVAYKNISEELCALARMLRVPFYKY